MQSSRELVLYSKFHVSRFRMFANNRNKYFFNQLKIRSGIKKNCELPYCGRQSQFSKVWPEFDTGRVNLDPAMLCADWPVAGNLTLFQTQFIGKLNPWHRHQHLQWINRQWHRLREKLITRFTCEARERERERDAVFICSCWKHTKRCLVYSLSLQIYETSFKDYILTMCLRWF